LQSQPNDHQDEQWTQTLTNDMEQEENKKVLTSELNVYTKTPCMGRPPKSQIDRRSKLFPLRLTPGEMTELESASRRLGESVADIFRKGAKLYMRGKDGSKRKEKSN
jgi:hypothetical protein